MAVSTYRAISPLRFESSAHRYCSRRRRTLPDTGPCTRARKRPFSARNDTATPCSAQWPRRNGLHKTFPKQTIPPSVWIGIRALLTPSTRTCTHSPSFDRYVPWVVTNSVFRCFFMALPGPSPDTGPPGFHGRRLFAGGRPPRASNCRTWGRTREAAFAPLPASDARLR